MRRRIYGTAREGADGYKRDRTGGYGPTTENLGERPQVLICNSIRTHLPKSRVVLFPSGLLRYCRDCVVFRARERYCRIEPPTVAAQQLLPDGSSVYPFPCPEDKNLREYGWWDTSRPYLDTASRRFHIGGLAGKKCSNTSLVSFFPYLAFLLSVFPLLARPADSVTVDSTVFQRSLRPSTVRATQEVKARRLGKPKAKTPKASARQPASPRSPSLPGTFPGGLPSIDLPTTRRDAVAEDVIREDSEDDAEVFITETEADDLVVIHQEDQGDNHGMGDAARQLSKALWRLELPEEDRFDGEDDNVEEFVSRLRGEIGLAVTQGHLDNEDVALKHMSNRLFTGTALTWLYDEGCGYQTLEEFLDGLQEWFGDRASGTQRRLALIGLKKKSSESPRAFALRLRAGNKRLPQADRLSQKELKYTLLLGSKNKGWLTKKVFKGKRYDDDNVRFDDVVEKLLDQGQGSDGEESATRRGLCEEDATKIAEHAAKVAAQAAAKETAAGMQKELATVKEELRLTAAQHRTRVPPKRVFNVEEVSDDGHPDDEHDDEAFVAEQNSAWRGQRNPPYRSQGYDRRSGRTTTKVALGCRGKSTTGNKTRPPAPAGSEHDAVLRDLLRGQQQMQQMFQQFLGMQVGTAPAGNGSKDPPRVPQPRPDDQGRPGFPLGPSKGPTGPAGDRRRDGRLYDRRLRRRPRSYNRVCQHDDV